MATANLSVESKDFTLPVVEATAGADGIVVQDDFNKAQDAPDGVGVAIYRTASGETVMAVCSLVPYAAEDVAAMRLVTSLTLVQAQLKSVFIVSLITPFSGGHSAGG